MKELVREKVGSAVKDTYGEKLTEVIASASFEKPKRKEHGDFATNVAFFLAKKLKQKPSSIASKLREALSSMKEFERVEVAGGGFLNFFFSQNVYVDILKKVLHEDFYLANVGNGRRVILEYVSANPTGPLHVGHGRGAVVGDVLYRVMKLTGFKPEREFYINDAGRQITLLGVSIYARMKEINGENYPFPENGYSGEYIVDVAKKLLESRTDILSLPEGKAVEIASQFGKEKLLRKIQEDLKRLKVEFDNWFSEKSLYEGREVERVLKFLEGKGLIYKKDGALWLKTTRFGDDKDRVVKRSNGEYTYFASDIAYHYNKIKRGYDIAIDIWGADHHGYIPRVKAAIQALGKNPDWLDVVLIQLVKLFKNGKEVKMSKRAGNFVTLSWLMNEVGVDAVRFFFLLKRHDTPLDFDIGLALSTKNENPVYYVQYAHARLCSILDKAGKLGFRPSEDNLELLSSEEERELISGCYNLKYELQMVAEKKEPHRLTYYLIDLASKLHRFYNKYRVIDEGNRELTGARLALIEAVKNTINFTLSILNVTAPRRM